MDSSLGPVGPHSNDSARIRTDTGKLNPGETASKAWRHCPAGSGIPERALGRKASPISGSSLRGKAMYESRERTVRMAMPSPHLPPLNVSRTDEGSSTRSDAVGWRRCRAGPGSLARAPGEKGDSRAFKATCSARGDSRVPTSFRDTRWIRARPLGTGSTAHVPTISSGKLDPQRSRRLEALRRLVLECYTRGPPGRKASRIFKATCSAKGMRAGSDSDLLRNGWIQTSASWVH